jgi:hypothetical protein
VPEWLRWVGVVPVARCYLLMTNIFQGFVKLGDSPVLAVLLLVHRMGQPARLRLTSFANTFFFLPFYTSSYCSHSNIFPGDEMGQWWTGNGDVLTQSNMLEHVLDRDFSFELTIATSSLSGIWRNHRSIHFLCINFFARWQKDCQVQAISESQCQYEGTGWCLHILVRPAPLRPKTVSNIN